MKNCFFVLIAVCLFTFACKKDDNTRGANATLYYGGYVNNCACCAAYAVLIDGELGQRAVFEIPQENQPVWPDKRISARVFIKWQVTKNSCLSMQKTAIDINSIRYY